MTNLMFLVKVTSNSTGLTVILDPQVTYSSHVSAETFGTEVTAAGLEFTVFSASATDLARSDNLFLIYFSEVILKADFAVLEASFSSLMEFKLSESVSITEGKNYYESLDLLCLDHAQQMVPTISLLILPVTVKVATIQESRTVEG